MFKLYHAWAQDEVNAAYLGMADEARRHIADRALTHSKNIYRWPAYWGPNFNWCPDQDEGGIFLSTIQSMGTTLTVARDETALVFFDIISMRFQMKDIVWK